MFALPIYLIEPIWKQFSNLLSARKVDHPLGHYRWEGGGPAVGRDLPIGVAFKD